jgi:ethanolamine utilization protein EutQ
MKKRLYTAADIQSLVRDQKQTTLSVAKGELVTPLALDAARELGVEVQYEQNGAVSDLPAWSGAAQNLSRNLSQNPGQTQPATLQVAQGDTLEAMVRQIVTAMVAGCHAPKPDTPVRHVDGRSIHLAPFPFDVNRPSMDIRLLDVITSEHGSPMAAGLMSFREGSFPWTLNYAEIDLVLEGELHIETTQGTVIGRPGDVLYIPKGSGISFATPSWTKFFYVTFPAEWSTQ